MKCCEVLTAYGKIFVIGKYRRQKSDYNKKPFYKSDLGNWCIFFSSSHVYLAHWKIDECSNAKEGTDWTLGWGWSDITPYCPGDIGANWRYYSMSDAGAHTGPVDPSIIVKCI